jgi:CHAD domain-containing protein
MIGPKMHATTVPTSELARVLRRHVNALVRALARARQRHGHVRAVHQARVASRRLREALPVANAVATVGTGGIRRAVRRLTSALGDVRELDVARHTLEARVVDDRWPFGAVAAVKRHLKTKRARGRDRMLPRIDRRDIDKLRTRVRTRAASIEASHASLRIDAVISRRVRERARKFVRHARHVGTMYSPEALHAVRIAAKKLRYSLELAKDVSGLPLGREIGQLKRLQTLMGELHDLQILTGYVRTVLTKSRVDPSNRKALDAMAVSFDAECRALHSKVLRHMPAVVELADRLAKPRVRLVTPRAKTKMARMTVPVTPRRSIGERATS